MVGSVAFASDCTRSADETVKCTDSELMWQDDSNAGSTKRNWQDAISYCEGLTLAGHNDWRLPNRNELKSIVDYEKSSGAKIKNGFTNTSSNNYWSSTTSAHSTSHSHAWNVYFSDGFVGVDKKSYAYYVRCVRVGQ